MNHSIMYTAKVVLLLLAFSCIGCNPKYYSPNTQNVPSISSKGDSHATLSGNGNQLEVQAAYGLTESLAGQLNGGLFIPKDLENGNGGSGNFFEAGLGYFKDLDSDLIFETYGLVGFGSMENYFPTATASTSGDISASAMRIGIQPSISYEQEKFSISGSARLARLSYTGIEGDLRYGGEDQIAYLTDNNTQLLIEPAATIRGGVELFKLQLQLGYSLNLTDSEFRQDEGFATFGVVLDLPSN